MYIALKHMLLNVLRIVLLMKTKYIFLNVVIIKISRENLQPENENLNTKSDDGTRNLYEKENDFKLF